MWPTPTPIPIGTPAIALPIDADQMMRDFGGNIVQGWNLFDASPVATVVFIGILLLLIFLGFMSIRSHLESL